MNKAWLLSLALLPGCWSSYDDGGGYRHGDRLDSFEADSNECTLVSTLALSGSSTTWSGCRLRYDDNARVYTWQITTPGTTGSWASQGPGWFTLSFNLDSPQNQTLDLSSVTAEEPPFVALDEVVFAYAPTAGATVGGTGSVDVGANIIYPGGTDSSLVAQLTVDAVGFGTFSGNLTATIAAPSQVDASVAAVDAACADDGGCGD